MPDFSFLNFVFMLNTAGFFLFHSSIGSTTVQYIGQMDVNGIEYCAYLVYLLILFVILIPFIFILWFGFSSYIDLLQQYHD